MGGGEQRAFVRGLRAQKEPATRARELDDDWWGGDLVVFGCCGCCCGVRRAVVDEVDTGTSANDAQKQGAWSALPTQPRATRSASRGRAKNELKGRGRPCRHRPERCVVPWSALPTQAPTRVRYMRRRAGSARKGPAPKADPAGPVCRISRAAGPKRLARPGRWSARVCGCRQGGRRCGKERAL